MTTNPAERLRAEADIRDADRDNYDGSITADMREAASALDAKDAEIARLKDDLAYHMHMAGEDKALLAEAMKALENFTLGRGESHRAALGFAEDVLTKLKAAGIREKSEND